MGILGTVWNRVVSMISSVEDLAFFILLIAFVGFAIHWFKLLLG